MKGDSNSVISASWDGTLKIWDLASGHELHARESHGSSVNAVAVSRDRKQAISASKDKTLKLWDLESGSECCVLKGHTGSVTATQFSGDGKRAISASWDRKLKLWDVQGGSELRTLKHHTAAISAFALIGEGKRAVFVSGNALVAIELENGHELYTLKSHTDSVSSVAVAADGKRALSASVDNTLKLWDLENGCELQTLRGHGNSVNAVAMTNDGKRAVSASADQTLKLWDLDSGRELSTLEGHTGSVHAVAVTGDGARAVSASRDSTLKIWDLENKSEIATFHTDATPTCCAFVDQNKIVAGDGAGRILFLQLVDSHNPDESLNGRSPDDAHQRDPYEPVEALESVPDINGDLAKWTGSTSVLTVVVVFTDIVESTVLCNKIGDIGWQGILRRHFARCTELIDRWRGILIKKTGDGILAFFHDATSAVEFAVQLDQNPGDSGICIRAGIHVGQINIENGDASGRTMNLAARVMAIGEHGGVVVTNRVREDIRHRGDLFADLRWTDLSSVRIRGFSSPETLWRVEREG